MGKSWLFILLLAIAAPALAQQPDCAVFGRTSTSGLHASSLVVQASRAMTLETHCNYGSSDPQPTFLWDTGETTFGKFVSAPANAGETKTHSVVVTQGSAQRTFTFQLMAAAAGTPQCLVIRDTGTLAPMFAAVHLTARCDNASSYQWTGGFDVRDANSAVATVFNVVNEGTPIQSAVDLIPANSAGTGAMVEANLQYAQAPPSCRILASPAGAVPPDTAVTLTADCDGSPTTSYHWSNGGTGSSIVVRPATTTEYSVNATNGAGTGVEVALAVRVASGTPALADTSGLWWVGPAENGWGATIIQHGRQIFGVLYFYDPEGRATWAYLSGGTWDATNTVFTGDVYIPSGSYYRQYDSTQFRANGRVGTASITFADASTAYITSRMQYASYPAPEIFSTPLDKKLVPLARNGGANPSGANYADMWWGGPSQNGWGLSLIQAGSTVFMPWFTYGDDGHPTWFLFQGDSWSGNAVTGTMYRSTGAPLLGLRYDPSVHQLTAAGSGTITFSAPDSAMFSYTLDGFPNNQPIQRLVF